MTPSKVTACRLQPLQQDVRPWALVLGSCPCRLHSPPHPPAGPRGGGCGPSPPCPTRGARCARGAAASGSPSGSAPLQCGPGERMGRERVAPCPHVASRQHIRPRAPGHSDRLDSSQERSPGRGLGGRCPLAHLGLVQGSSGCPWTGPVYATGSWAGERRAREETRRRRGHQVELKLL